MSRNELNCTRLRDPQNDVEAKSYTSFLLVLGLVAFAVIATVSVLIDWAWANWSRTR